MPALFSYGTLQDKAVQLATFGRELAGHPDALPGFIRSVGPPADPALVPPGETNYVNLIPSSTLHDLVPGTVFELTDAEIAAADDYEQDAGYRRIRVTLHSGDQAWVY